MNAAPQPFETSWEECIELLDSLPSMPIEARVDAIEKLIRNPSPGIRSRALRMGAAVIPDERLKYYLRSDADDVLRNAGVEMLKMRGHRGFSLTLQLLKDLDPDVVLQAVIVLKHLRDPRALEPLRVTLHHEDPNVVQEAIVAIGQLGDARAIPDLLPFLTSDPWVQMAAVEALGNLRSPVAV
ncbi:MAG: HEAT repeat domain-containing protein, partial [Thermoanaerobaculia bacterium]|nr:HEAT repeat domain-containing protein [Thermoanaerobaculia bacterium]